MQSALIIKDHNKEKKGKLGKVKSPLCSWFNSPLVHWTKSALLAPDKTIYVSLFKKEMASAKTFARVTNFFS